MNSERDKEIISKGAWYVLFGIALAIGAFLRYYMISSQIIADDEMHALLAVMQHSSRYIFTHFFRSDICIPLSLIYKAIADTIGLSELTMRLPSLLSGICTVCLLPLFARRLAGRTASSVYALLLAISPLLVFYSRFARPYSICVFFAATAIFSFYLWLSTERTRWSVAYVIASVTAGYFHTLVIPAVVTPLLFGMLLLPTIENRAERLSRFRSLCILGVATTAGLCSLLLAPLVSSAGIVFEKAGRGSLTISTLWESVMLFAGTGHRSLAALMLATTLAGISITLKRDARWGFYLLFVSAVQIAAVLLVAPEAIQHPIVLARYVIVVLPLLLLFPAEFLAALARLTATKNRSGLCALVYVAIAAVLFLFGPIPRCYYSPNNFTNHNMFQHSYRESHPKQARISQFYYELGKRKEDFSIVETPWYYPYPWNRLPVYQRVHRKNVLVSFLHSDLERYVKRLDKRRYAFTHYLDLSDEGDVRRSGVRYIVVHKDLKGEMAPHSHRPSPDAGPLTAFLRERYGGPVFEDADIIVFEVSNTKGVH
jgi:uncharacterized membrane protein